MTNTDKTHPVWAKAIKFPERMKPYHDHSKGPCDLLLVPEWAKLCWNTPWKDWPQCGWEPKAEFYHWYWSISGKCGDWCCNVPKKGRPTQRAEWRKDQEDDRD